MIIFGVIAMVAGIVMCVAGYSLNNDYEARWDSYLKTGNSEPGNIWLIIGAITVVLGLILLIVGIVSKSKSKEYPQMPYQMPYQPPYYQNPGVPQQFSQPIAPQYAQPAPQPVAQPIATQAAPSQSFCINCGAPLVSGSKFCSNCGQSISE